MGKNMKRKKYLISVLSIILSLSFNLNGCGQKENVQVSTATCIDASNETNREDVTDNKKETANDAAAKSETETESMSREITEVTEITESTTNTEEPNSAQTPLALHGALHVEGTALTDSHGNPVQLRGMSTHGIAW